MKAEEAVRRFSAKYETDDETGCWLWTAGVGRAQFKVRRRTASANRWAYEQRHGPIEPGQWLARLCEGTACVNPDHHRVVAPGEVVGRFQRAKTHCPKGHLYDEANTYVTPKGKRMCRTCRRWPKKRVVTTS